MNPSGVTCADAWAAAQGAGQTTCPDDLVQKCPSTCGCRFTDDCCSEDSTRCDLVDASEGVAPDGLTCAAAWNMAQTTGGLTTCPANLVQKCPFTCQCPY